MARATKSGTGTEKAGGTSTKKTTKTSSTTTGKVGGSTVRARAASAAPRPELKVVTPAASSADAPELKKRELIDRVVALSGIKKKDAKPVVEAMLRALGEALGEGRELNLQPLGKVKVTRRKDLDSGKVVIARIRQSTNSIADLETVPDELKEALADEDDEG